MAPALTGFSVDVDVVPHGSLCGVWKNYLHVWFFSQSSTFDLQTLTQLNLNTNSNSIEFKYGLWQIDSNIGLLLNKIKAANTNSLRLK